MKFNHENILAAVETSWGWAFPKVDQILAVNGMGNVFLKTVDGNHWRICPEELSVSLVADNDAEATAVFESKDFKADWQLQGMIKQAEKHFGTLSQGQCYGMEEPAVIGGEYELHNLFVADVVEYLIYTGKLAEQIKDVPDGEMVDLEFD